MRVQQSPKARPGSPGSSSTPAVTKPSAGPAALGRSPIDTFGAAAIDVGQFSSFLQDQGATNSCGTTSLAMLMSFWHGKAGAYTHQMIDASIRQFDAPTAPTNVVRYLKNNGFRAEALNHAKISDLVTYLDRGVPVEVLYDPDANPRDAYLHYVDVIGYDRDAKGEVSSLKIADPAGGYIHDVPVDEFKSRWGRLKFKNVAVGADNLMIVALPEQNKQVRGRDGVLRNTKDIALPAHGNNWGLKLRVGDVIADVANGAGKVVGAIKKLFRRR